MCVSDALQAIVRFKPIAIWVGEICVEISQGEAFKFRHLKIERYDTVELATGGKESEARRRERRRAERVTKLSGFRFQVSSVVLE